MQLYDGKILPGAGQDVFAGNQTHFESSSIIQKAPTQLHHLLETSFSSMCTQPHLCTYTQHANTHTQDEVLPLPVSSLPPPNTGGTQLSRFGDIVSIKPSVCLTEKTLLLTIYFQ